MYFAYARTALKYGLKHLDFNQNDTVLLPEYICDAILQPFDQLGINYIFYRINDDLSPDWININSTLYKTKCKAILMVHYFGQPQNIERFLQFSLDNNLILLEDNAHGFSGTYNGKVLGSSGAIGISSPRKILNVAFGGILTISGQTTKPPKSLSNSNLDMFVVLSKLGLNSFPRIKMKLQATIHKLDLNDPFSFCERIVPENTTDLFSTYYINRANWPNIAAQRRKYWIVWATWAIQNGLQPAYSFVSSESCPWAIPIYAKDILERNLWIQYGQKKGFCFFPWPSLPRKVLCNSRQSHERWNRLFCILLDKGQ